MDKFNIKNLNLHYNTFHALKDVNLDIEQNCITAFIGPSGCGKSTLLKCLNNERSGGGLPHRRAGTAGRHKHI